MSYKITGELISIGQEQKVSDTFNKLAFVLKTDLDKPYPQTLEFELHKDRIDLLSPYQVGQLLELAFA